MVLVLMGVFAMAAQCEVTLLYDDGNDTADDYRQVSEPVTHLVRFSVPTTLTGSQHQVTKITWYPGYFYFISDPKVVARVATNTLVFGQSQNCVVQDAVPEPTASATTTPTQFRSYMLNRVDISQNDYQVQVVPGDDFFAGVAAQKMHLGMDVLTAGATATFQTTVPSTQSCPTSFPSSQRPAPPTQFTGSMVTTPTSGGASFVQTHWAGRNYELKASGVLTPAQLIETVTVSEDCTGWFVSTPTPARHCQCNGNYNFFAQNWLIRATLAGSSSPELGCYRAIVWVNLDATTAGQGIETDPFNVLDDGVVAVGTGGRVNIFPSRASGAFSITKPLSLHAVGGVVVLGQSAV